MTHWGLKKEYPIDIGSGICLGVIGKSGAHIDHMGFLFISDVKTTVLNNVVYPPMSSVKLSVKKEQLYNRIIVNNTTVIQEQTLKFSKTLTTKSSWTVTNKMEFTFSLRVSAGLPELVHIESDYSFTLGTERSCNLEESVEVSRKDVIPVKVPPNTMVTVTGTIDSIMVDLPYNGTVFVTCIDGNVITFPTSGVYKGLMYTATKTTFTETKMYSTPSEEL